MSNAGLEPSGLEVDEVSRLLETPPVELVSLVALEPAGFVVLVDLSPARVVGLTGALDTGAPDVTGLLEDAGFNLLLEECKLLTKGLLRLEEELTEDDAEGGLELTFDVFS